MSKAQTLKSIIKKNVGEKPTFGTNPWDPWSAKANIAEESDISEDAMLDRYLITRGINPKHVTKDQKVAHSKMGQFNKWKRDHSNFKEDVDKKDTVTFDIPLLIRVLELAREDIKSDMDLHRVVERLINIRDKGMLTMDDYDFIAHIKEAVEPLDEISTYGYHKAAIKSRQDAAVKVMSSMGQDKSAKTKLNARNAGLKRLSDRTSAEMKKANSGPQKPVHHPASSMSSPQAYYASKKPGEYTGDSVEYPDDTNVIAELNDTTLSSYKEKAKKSADELASRGEYRKSTNRWSNVMKATGKQMDKTTASIKKSLSKEEVEEVQEVAPPGFEGTVKAMKKYKKIDNPWALAWSMKNKGYKSHKKADGTMKNENVQDPMAATSMPCDSANNSDDVMPKDKNKKLIQMSKSARIIKSIYKKQNVKEELYDHEKEDKSVATYGKKPKMQKVSTDLEEPKAAAVLTGGTTLTGEKRDTIEIDPMMKMRKPISGKR
jgi:hypothetical protein